LAIVPPSECVVNHASVNTGAEMASALTFVESLIANPPKKVYQSL
jgi:hypothetical protein